jgi:hypothetical protein
MRYHVWWDPKLAEQIARASAERRLASFQVCDWLPLRIDAPLGRGHVGDGWIDVPGIAAMVRAAGDTEVEISNQDVWDADRGRPPRPSSNATSGICAGSVRDPGVGGHDRLSGLPEPGQVTQGSCPRGAECRRHR